MSERVIMGESAGKFHLRAVTRLMNGKCERVIPIHAPFEDHFHSVVMICVQFIQRDRNRYAPVRLDGELARQFVIRFEIFHRNAFDFMMLRIQPDLCRIHRG